MVTLNFLEFLIKPLIKWYTITLLLSKSLYVVFANKICVSEGERQMAEIEKVYPLAPVDQILEEYLGLPGTKSLLDALPLPARVMKILGIPTPASVVKEVVTKVSTALEAKVR